jgi:type IV secretory pathway TrbL component
VKNIDYFAYYYFNWHEKSTPYMESMAINIINYKVKVSIPRLGILRLLPEGAPLYLESEITF